MTAKRVMTEKDRVERFEAAYNRIDHALTEMTERRGHRQKHPFAAKVRIAANRYRRLGKYVDFLLEIGDLRNAIVHNRTDQDYYIAVPNEDTVTKLEAIEQRMFSPPSVSPQFVRKVITLRADQSLVDVLELVRNDGYSRYPVYEDKRFVGLLTTNGLARWMAEHAKTGRLDVDLREVSIEEVVAADHRKDSVAFVARSALLDDVDAMFSDHKPLEAVIITEHGKPHETPIGLISPADIAALED
ncbi:MAG: CBS domain-containing protein [Planctomycetes bacterium]|nr:CBS domain-containing protein [Planctomycetota bacterium]MCH8209989.1 CBS domain-containing protein [Planctomycetota bacterium]